MCNVCLLSGNEAIARGAYESGIRYATAYPGTPSTEILENIARYPEINTHWAINEKVAVEEAIGASLGGLRSLVAMKHVGLNVAADPLFTASYIGVRAGLVIVTADDPGMHSSQNEQDNRNYAPFAKIPMLEPADSDEARRFVKIAVQLSEEFDTPVLIRSTTRLSHAKTRVYIDTQLSPPFSPTGFERNTKKYVMIPAYGIERHKAVERRTLTLKEFAETFPENKVICCEEDNNSAVGIITAGIAYQYVMEVFASRVDVLKLGMVFPLPEKKIREFVSQHKICFVIEELDPYLDHQIRALGIPLWGAPALPRCGELSPDLIRRQYLHLVDKPDSIQQNSAPEVKTESTLHEESSNELPPRPPVMCAGCPHRGVFYILHKLKLFVTGDIGCYTLGTLPPLLAIDTCVCMGASVGMQIGLEAAIGAGKSVAIIGDSTFLHSGITPLIDMVYTQGHGTVIILDNSTTAMTGGQPHPATGLTITGKPAPRISFKKLCEGIGIEDVKIVDPYNLKETEMAIKSAIANPAPSVIITSRPCLLLPEAGEQCWKKTYYVDSELCVMCGACLQLGCPAIAADEATTKPHINPNFCTGCSLCEQICPTGAINWKER